jgi:hypothetical protein
MMQMKRSVLPFFAVTFSFSVSPFSKPKTAESPGWLTFGGVSCPLPFSR